MRTEEQIQSEISSVEHSSALRIGRLRAELAQVRQVAMDARREAGKNDPTSGFYEGYARDAWGYPLDPLMCD